MADDPEPTSPAPAAATPATAAAAAKPATCDAVDTAKPATAATTPTNANAAAADDAAADTDAADDADDADDAAADDTDDDAEDVEPAPDREPATLAVGGALRCHVDQLPPDRCVLCGTPGQPDDVAQVALCQHHRQKPRIPFLLGCVLTISTTVFTVLHGTENLMQTVCGFLLAGACFAIARQRSRLRARFPAPSTTGLLELADVTPDISRAVIALGSRPYRKSLPRARARVAQPDAD